MQMKKKFLAAAIVALAASGSAMAPAIAKAPDKPWLVHFRAITVSPDESATVSIGGGVEIDEAYVPEIDISYFFDEEWSVELIAATSPHDVVHSSGLDLGSAWVLPPTLTLKYHPPVSGPVRPYVGAGINYTTFWNIDDPAGLNMDYSDSWGLAVQAGVDIDLGDNWTFNIDVKKIDINTDVRITTAAGAFVADADVEIDPWVVGIGVGYRF
jgi:outer membrane protein